MRHDVEDGGGGAAVLDRGNRQSGSPGSQAGGDPQEIQRKMEAAATPGRAHKALEPLVGSWKAEVKCWQKADGPPEVSQATARTRWILNGHYLEEEFNGEMMGKRFTGRSLLGFDNTKQKFNMLWISDMQTSMFFTEGKGENDYKVLTLEGTTDCPGTGQRDIPMRTIFRVLTPDKHVFEMYDGSRNAKTMEITYTRT